MFLLLICSCPDGTLTGVQDQTGDSSVDDIPCTAFGRKRKREAGGPFGATAGNQKRQRTSTDVAEESARAEEPTIRLLDKYVLYSSCKNTHLFDQICGFF